MPQRLDLRDPALQRLTSGFVSFDKGAFTDDVAMFTRDVLKRRGQLPDGHLLAQADARKLAREVEPEMRRLMALHGDTLDVRVAERAVDKAKFKMESKKTDRRAWWVSGGIFFGALLGFAGINYGINLGLKAAFTEGVATAIQAAWNPVFYTVGGALVGACTGLFNDKISSPVRAFINRFGFKGAPVQAQDVKAVRDEMIFSNMVENTADGRFNGGRFALTVFEIHLAPTFREVGEQLAEARKAQSPEAKKEAIDLAAMFMARRLINTELYWFNFDPHNLELFANLSLVVSPHFKGASPEDIAAFRKAVVEEVQRERKNVASEGRPDTATAIKDYNDPFLDRYLDPKKPSANSDVEQPVEGPVLKVEKVVHAG
jgi:hypothetical protein